MADILNEVADLYAVGYSQRDIAAQLGVNRKKVLQILVTAGALETDESTLYAQGYTVEQIAALLGKEVKSVQGRIPYQKGMYKTDNPTSNALRIRKCRNKSGG